MAPSGARSIGAIAGVVRAGIVAAVIAGCDGATGTPSPHVPTWSAPPDWVVVATDGGDLTLTLPPWLVTFDNRGAIFANEPPEPGAEIPVQLLAMGPDRAAQLEFGTNLVAWIDLHVSGAAQGLTNPGEGRPSVTGVQLPAGPGVRYERIDRPGTALEWRFLVFAIRTPTGLVYLQFDGTAAGWTERSAEFDHIALLLRTR